MLASPDIDVDVFRRQIAEIENGQAAPPITLFVAQDDKALGLSQLIAGDEPRLGAVDPTPGALPQRSWSRRMSTSSI